MMDFKAAISQLREQPSHEQIAEALCASYYAVAVTPAGCKVP